MIRSRWIRVALDYTPALLGFLLLADWLVGQNIYTGDLFLLTAALLIHQVASKLPSYLSRALSRTKC